MTIGARIPNWTWVGMIVLIPLLWVWKGGERSLMALGISIIVALGFLIYQFKWIPWLFILVPPFVLLSMEESLAGGSSISLPGEPLAILLLNSLGFAFLLNGEFRTHLLKSRSFWLMVVLIGSYWVTTLFSTMLEVSVKFSMINTLFIATGYLASVYILKYHKDQLRLFFRVAGVSLAFISIYSISRQVPYSFSPGSAPIMARPFFKDHTILGAGLGLWPFIFIFWSRIFPGKGSVIDRIMPVVGSAIVVVVILTTSRAAWIGIFVASLIAFLFWRGWRISRILLTGFIVLSALSIWGYYHSDQLFSNSRISTGEFSSMEDQAYSITNFNTDVSNLERINRWKNAIRMGRTKPWVGYGPGTYQFQYLPWQRQGEMTAISVTHPYSNIIGRGGSAHSEFLLVFSEMGWIGLLTFILVLVWILFSGASIPGKTHMSPLGWLALALWLGLITYIIHGLFNNFLNTDKTGLIFWMWTGWLLWITEYSTDEG